MFRQMRQVVFGTRRVDRVTPESAKMIRSRSFASVDLPEPIGRRSHHAAGRDVNVEGRARRLGCWVGEGDVAQLDRAPNRSAQPVGPPARSGAAFITLPSMRTEAALPWYSWIRRQPDQRLLFAGQHLERHSSPPSSRPQKTISAPTATIATIINFSSDWERYGDEHIFPTSKLRCHRVGRYRSPSAGAVVVRGEALTSAFPRWSHEHCLTLAWPCRARADAGETVR